MVNAFNLLYTGMCKNVQLFKMLVSNGQLPFQLDHSAVTPPHLTSSFFQPIPIYTSYSFIPNRMHFHFLAVAPVHMYKNIYTVKLTQ